MLLDRKAFEEHFMRRSGDGKFARDQLLSRFDETARMVDEQIARFKLR